MHFRLAIAALTLCLSWPAAAVARPDALPANTKLASAAQAAKEAPATIPMPSLKTPEERQAFAGTICGEIEARATEHALPNDFMVRLIWKESMFDPGAVSPVGAQGIAQFMPGTAKLRGLADPFEWKSAVAASAHYLADLRSAFGNLGLAAAAYNAGEQRVRNWLSGSGGLPYETQDYVLSITGRSHDEWKDAKEPFTIPEIGKSGTFGERCNKLVLAVLSPEPAKERPALAAATPAEPRANWKPWGVVLSGGFSEAKAMSAFRRIKKRYVQIIGDEQPLVLRKRNLSMGRRKIVQVMIGRNSRAEAQKLCQQITAAGGACMVDKN